MIRVKPPILYDLFLEYANTQIELLKYAYSIPLDELEIFSKIKLQTSTIFYRIK